MSQDWSRSLSLAALIQLATASWENHWHGAGVGCEDVIGGRLRSARRAVWQTPPSGPALVDSMQIGMK